MDSLGNLNIDYREVANKTAETLKSYLKDETGWEIAKKTTDILIECKKSTEFAGHLYRGQSEFSCEPQVVFSYIDPLPGDSPRLRWDKAMKKIETIKELADDLRITRTCTNSACMGMISPRDFVDLVYTKQEENGISTNGVSIELSDSAPNGKYVRGWNHHCGIICITHPDKPGVTKVTSLIQPDIRGMLPRALVESAIPGSMVDFFTNLRACLKADGKLSSE